MNKSLRVGLLSAFIAPVVVGCGGGGEAPRMVGKEVLDDLPQDSAIQTSPKPPKLQVDSGATSVNAE